MKSTLRLISNLLLPIGLCLLAIYLDFTYQDWTVNAGFITFVIFVAFLRGIVSKRENIKPIIKA